MKMTTGRVALSGEIDYNGTHCALKMAKLGCYNVDSKSRRVGVPLSGQKSFKSSQILQILVCLIMTRRMALFSCKSLSLAEQMEQ